MMLVDIEGVTGITTFPQAEHGQIGIDMMMHDINAVLEGILSVPGNEVLIYEQHTDGCNIVLDDLPEGVHVVRGKPVINKDWKGIDPSYDGLIMLGFHAKKGVPEALLAHSYGPQNGDIRINGLSVGEIGVECGVAGDFDVPLVLLTGDSAGCVEALKLVPGAMTVSVKQSLDDSCALCYNPKDTRRMLRDAGKALAIGLPAAQPLKFGGRIRLEIDLLDGLFLNTLKALEPGLFTAERTSAFDGATVTEAWQQYLRVERRVNRAL